jgi:hypothetical protein
LAGGEIGVRSRALRDGEENRIMINPSRFNRFDAPELEGNHQVNSSIEVVHFVYRAHRIAFQSLER